MNINADSEKYGYVNNCSKIVSWSGGLDSTLILYGLLKTEGRFNDPIGALSLKAYFLLDTKADSEKFHREKFIDGLVKPNGYNMIYEELNMNIVSSSGTFMTQLMNWLNIAVTVASREATIYLGVLKDDEQSLFMDEVMEYHSMLNRMTDKKTKLETPLINFYKKDIIGKVFAAGLENYVWFCEVPNKKNVCCGKCGSCRHFIHSAVMAYSEDSNKKIKSFLKRKLKFDLDDPKQLIELMVSENNQSKYIPQTVLDYYKNGKQKEISGN